jgi:long-subunit acyl-CoA synthetase (AMP-forming)
VKLPDHLLDVLHGRATELQPTSWRQFAQKVRQQTLGLRKRGLKRGDRIAVPELAREEAWVARLAVLALGGQYVRVTGAAGEAAWLGKLKTKAAYASTRRRRARPTRSFYKTAP